MRTTPIRGSLLETALDHINTSICIVDQQSIVKFWNSEAVRFYNILKKDIIGRKIADFFPKALLPKVIREQKAFEDVYNNPKEGYYIVISAVPLYNADRRLIGGISIDRDITDYIETQALLEKTIDNINLLKDEINAINQSQYSFSRIIGKDETFMKAVRLCKDISDSHISVLLQGDSGTGKEIIARGIHTESRRKGPFIPLNCSAIPAHLFESELFGYEGGAFTGAQRKGKVGKMEAADKGTLFLDEIGDLPLDMQPKLLRVLETGTISKLGSIKEIPVDIRLIAATHKDLKKEVELGNFRQDLYYRLNPVVIQLPPLRERKEDIPRFIRHFMEAFCMEYGVNMPILSDVFLQTLTDYEWEGNIRELKNVMERVVILFKKQAKEPIDTEYLPEYILSKNLPAIPVEMDTEDLDLIKKLEKTEKETILLSLKKSKGHIGNAAGLLKIPRTSLYYKLKKHHLRLNKTVHSSEPGETPV